MQLISGAIGETAANAIHDVALVQAILMKTTRAAASGRAAAPYLASYDGVCGNGTINAIKAFQTDHVFVSTATQQSVPNPNATAGQVKPGDATWTQMLAKVATDFANLGVLTSGKIVYVQATDAERLAKIAAVGTLTFTAAFGTKVRACINQMYALHGIAIGVCVDGDRRAFQRQYELLQRVPSVTNAGPGESNHNFGMATDIGFAGLRWLHTDGVIDSNETSWLHHLAAAHSAEATRFWDALRTVGTSATVGAFRGPVGDRPHLQNWADANVSMRARLAAHLQASGTMLWSHSGGTYRSDLGLDGAQYAVGTASQIWTRNATVTAANITQARAAAAALAPRRAATPAPVTAPATAADVTAMRQLLRDQFDLADANWQNWTAN